MSVFWFETTGHIVPNHYISQDVPEEVAGRALRVKRLEMYPVECVARGYLTGSGWREYRETGVGLRDRAARGPARVRQAAGADLHPGDQGRGRRPRREHRLRARGRADRRPGADGGAAPGRRSSSTSTPATTRPSAGSSSPTPSSSSAPRPGAEVVLGDEVLTPDSSRFWPADDYEPGRGAGLVRQAVRPRLARRVGLGPLARPGPELPDEVVADTRAKYVEAYERITGRDALVQGAARRAA